MVTSSGAEAVLGLGGASCVTPQVLLTIKIIIKIYIMLINQDGVGNCLLENAFIPAERLQQVHVFGSPVCAFPWQRPLGPVPPGHVSGDKPRQEQMALELWLCASSVAVLFPACLGIRQQHIQLFSLLISDLHF